MSALARLVYLLHLCTAPRPAPARPEPARVHRNERELVAGTAFLGAPATPRAKLPPAEAERLLGIPVRVFPVRVLGR